MLDQKPTVEDWAGLAAAAAAAERWKKGILSVVCVVVVGVRKLLFVCVWRR